MSVRVGLLALPLLLACGGGPASPSAPVPAPLGVPFALRPGQQAQVQGTPVRLRFTEVPADSRCPQGAVCVWAGDALVVLAARGGGEPATLKLHTGAGGPSEADYGGYRVALVGLAPIPRTDRAPAASEYVATLEVTRP